MALEGSQFVSFNVKLQKMNLRIADVLLADIAQSRDAYFLGPDLDALLFVPVGHAVVERGQPGISPTK